MSGNYRFISAEQKRLVLTMSLHGMMVKEIDSLVTRVDTEIQGNDINEALAIARSGGWWSENSVCVTHACSFPK